MRGMATSWPAINDPKRRWGNLEYLQETVGDLLVNVEVRSVGLLQPWLGFLLLIERWYSFQGIWHCIVFSPS